MECDEAAEYVSALCDGAIVPAAAAEHMNTCDACRLRLNEYLEIGAELRRMASLEISELQSPQFRPEPRSVLATLWGKGRKTMRIPRLAFVALLVAIVVLGSAWARQSVRADTQGSVLLIQYTTGAGPSSFCALSTVDKKFDTCGGIAKVQSGSLVWEIQALSKNGDRATLGVRAIVRHPESSADSSKTGELPQKQYVFTPGEKLDVDIDDLGTMSLTGQWIDHIPALPGGPVGENQDLDPASGELRLFGPLLLHGGQVAGDLSGGNAAVDQPGNAVEFYLKGVGRFDFSLSPMPGAVEGKVQFNRIDFTVDGQSYTLVSGAPICRERRVWVRYDRYDPNSSALDSTGSWFITTTEISKLPPATARN